MFKLGLLSLDVGNADSNSSDLDDLNVRDRLLGKSGVNYSHPAFFYEDFFHHIRNNFVGCRGS